MSGMDHNEFRRLGYQLVDWIADYREGLERLPVMSRVQPGETQEDAGQKQDRRPDRRPVL